MKLLPGERYGSGSLGCSLPAFKGPEWVFAGLASAAIAVVFLEGWETRTGNDRPVLKAAVGTLFSFLAEMRVERAIGNFRLHVSNYRRIIDVLLGLASLVLSIHQFMGRKEPRSMADWLYERVQPLSMFNKKTTDLALG
jgi:hypothetical protein